MSEQMILALFEGNNLQTWKVEDLLEWASQFGAFEVCKECSGDPDRLCRFHMSKKLGTCHDAIKSVDVLPPIIVFTVLNTKGEQRLHMMPQCIDDWNRGCPGCSSNMPDWVTRHIVRHTGQNFGNAADVFNCENDE